MSSQTYETSEGQEIPQYKERSNHKIYKQSFVFQKDAIVSKLSSLKQVKDAATRKDAVDNWKAATIKSVDKTEGVDSNQVTQFGLKLKEKGDYYSELIFDDYEDL